MELLLISALFIMCVGTQFYAIKTRNRLDYYRLSVYRIGKATMEDALSEAQQDIQNLHHAADVERWNRKKLEQEIKYLKTREEGEFLAYRLAREMGASQDDAEKYARYEILGTEELRVRVVIQLPELTQEWELEEAKLRLNERLVKKHEDCMQLDAAEEKIILARRRKDWDSHWVQVKPRSKKGKGK